jgi:hypothetical protein
VETIAAATTAAAASHTAVAAPVAPPVKAALPTAAVSKAAAAATEWRTHAAAKKEAAEVGGGCAGMFTSPSPPALPAERKKQCQQSDNMPGRMGEANGGSEARNSVIPQVEGDIPIWDSDLALLPSMPPPLAMSPLPPDDQSFEKKKPCSLCKVSSGLTLILKM